MLPQAAKDAQQTTFIMTQTIRKKNVLTCAVQNERFICAVREGDIRQVQRRAIQMLRSNDALGQFLHQGKLPLVV